MLIQKRDGTSYVEYFIAAAAMALATLAVLDHLKSSDFVTPFQGQFDDRMHAIAGE